MIDLFFFYAQMKEEALYIINYFLFFLGFFTIVLGFGFGLGFLGYLSFIL